MIGRSVLFCLLLATACGAAPPTIATATTAPRKPITITTKHTSEREEATRTQLTRLLATYDLEPWLFTRTIDIDEDAIPHSHPVLTLHARHLKQDDELVSTLIHEELHWHMMAPSQRDGVARAVDDLKITFPSLPIGFPEGAQTEQSNYEHLPIIYLEYEGLKSVVGETRAKEAFTFWEGDHYRALYRLLRAHHDEIGTVTQKHALAP